MMKRRDIIKIVAAAPAGIVSLAINDPSHGKESDKIRTIEAPFQKVTVSTGDVIILMIDSLLSMRAHAHIKKCLEAIFPDHKILIIEDGMKLGVLAKEAV